MINSCVECKSKCCQTGTGPHKLVSPEEYLDNFGYASAYNMKCKHFVNGKCNIWGTKHLPVDCRIYVCQTRLFNKNELEIIKNIEKKNND